MSIPTGLPPSVQRKGWQQQERPWEMPAVADPIHALANQVFNNVPEVPAEELPRNMNYAQCKEKLKECIEGKDYPTAFIIADMLYIKKLKKNQKEWLLGKFEDLCKLGPNTVGKRFYAFLRTAVTRELAEQPNHNREAVIAGYEEAMALDYSPAAYNLACYFGDKDECEEALKRWIAGSKQFPQEPIFYNNAGYYYANGLGTRQDLGRAGSCYQAAINLGCGESAANLAELLQANPLEEGKRQRVIDLYTIAKDKNVAMSAWNLGVIHQNGWYKTDSQKKGHHKNEFIDLDQAEANFRKAYEINESKIRFDPNAKEELPDCALAIAEIIFANESRYTEDRWDEMLEYIEFAKEYDRVDAELNAKIREKRKPVFAQALPTVAGKAPMKRLLITSQLLDQEEEQERADGAKMVMHFCVALKALAKQPADHDIVAAKSPAKRPAHHSTDVPQLPAKRPAIQAAQNLLREKIARLESELKQHPGNDEIIVKLCNAKYKASKII